MALRKEDIAQLIEIELGFPKSRSKELVESVLEIMKQSLEKGEEVKISGFGKFFLIDKEARNGRNPQTGEDIIIEPRRVVSFKFSSQARAKLNGELTSCTTQSRSGAFMKRVRRSL